MISLYPFLLIFYFKIRGKIFQYFFAFLFLSMQNLVVYLDVYIVYWMRRKRLSMPEQFKNYLLFFLRSIAMNLMQAIGEKRIIRGEIWFQPHFKHLSPLSRIIYDRLREKATMDEVIEEIAYDMFCKPRNVMLSEDQKRSAAVLFGYKVREIRKEFGV